MKTTFLCLSLLLSSLWVWAEPQSGAGYTGKLNTELIPNNSFNMSIRFDAATDADISKLPAPLAAGDKAFVRKVKWPPEVGNPLVMILVESASGEPYLYADIDLDGAFSSAERFPFPRFKTSPGPADDLVLKLPFKFSGTIYPTFPVTLRPRSAKGESREVFYSNKAYVTGIVDVGGKKTLFQYGIDAKTGKSDPAFEGLGVDTNRDGHIDSEPNTPETDYGNRGAAIFRVGQHFVSTESVDTAAGKITLKSHAASEYQRIELIAGAEIPDFSFLDFNDKPRKLSDFRGKYLLLDFWGTWCGPCIAEMPFLKELYGKFRSRNFEIVGMDNEAGWDEASAEETAKGVERAKTFVKQRGIEWPQARTDSISRLVRNGFRVRSYPMKLLLDQRGRIVLLISDGGHQELIDKLEKLLPPAKL